MVHHQDLIKQYRLSKDCGNQTSFVSTTPTGDKNPNDETAIDTGNGAIENTEEKAEVSSKHSATHGSRKQPSIANSRSSKRLQIDQMELENLKAKKETEQRLRERQLELEQEREEIELRRQQEELPLQQQEQELRLKMQQQEDELRLRNHERGLENERKKAEEEEEESRMKLELTKESSRASGAVAVEIESVGSKRNHERIAGWAESVAQQSVPRRPLSPNVVIDPPTII